MWYLFARTNHLLTAPIVIQVMRSFEDDLLQHAGDCLSSTCGDGVKPGWHRIVQMHQILLDL